LQEGGAAGEACLPAPRAASPAFPNSALLDFTAFSIVINIINENAPSMEDIPGLQE
jgi:hypothetical protein